MTKRGSAGLLMIACLFAGCTSGDAQPSKSDDGIVVVPAALETDPVASLDDAADDPAIWRNPADPAASLIVATDKRAGLHVYDLRGRRLSSTASPRLNNVDLRDGVTIGGGRGVLVAASDREDPAEAKMALFALHPTTGRLARLGVASVGPGEAYGMCLWKRARDGVLFGFIVIKDGRIDQMAIDASGAAARATKVRSLKLASQAEGCVVDDRTGLLYVAEEDVGLWRFDAEPAGSAHATAIAKVDGVALVADVEGLAIAPVGRSGGVLVASSQGDGAFAVYRLPAVTFAGKFRVGANAAGSVDAVGGTDGIDMAAGSFGPAFPAGLLVVQDGDNAPRTQNFKLIDWARVEAAIR